MSRKGCIPIKADSGKNICQFKNNKQFELCLGFSSKIIDLATGKLIGKHLIKKGPRDICQMVADGIEISKNTFQDHCELQKCITKDMSNNSHRYKFFKGRKGDKKVYWYVYSQKALKGC
jgi:hypothetical protein